MCEDRSLKLSGELTIRRADELHRLFVEAAGQEGGLVLDLSGVEQCDAAGLQLICALRKTLAGRGSSLRVSAIPAAVQLTATALGMPLEGVEP